MTIVTLGIVVSDTDGRGAVTDTTDRVNTQGVPRRNTLATGAGDPPSLIKEKEFNLNLLFETRRNSLSLRESGCSARLVVPPEVAIFTKTQSVVRLVSVLAQGCRFLAAARVVAVATHALRVEGRVFVRAVCNLLRLSDALGNEVDVSIELVLTAPRYLRVLRGKRRRLLLIVRERLKTHVGRRSREVGLVHLPLAARLLPFHRLGDFSSQDLNQRIS